MTVQEMVDSLRELAVWYEQHPTLPIPYDLDNESGMFVFFYGLEGQFKNALREIGDFEKEYGNPSPDDFCAVKKIGAFTLKFHSKRNQVCTPRIVGTKQIDRQVIPERVIEAHTEEIIEWDCEPILKN